MLESILTECISNGLFHYFAGECPCLLLQMCKCQTVNIGKVKFLIPDAES